MTEQLNEWQARNLDILAAIDLNERQIDKAQSQVLSELFDTCFLARL
jgi:hypothetical protein